MTFHFVSNNVYRTFSFLFIIWLSCKPIDNSDFDPSTSCEVSCDTGTSAQQKSSACNCSMGYYHKEILDQIIPFRREVLKKHNDLRDYIASGTETSKNWSEAANMLALNYDLELEYVARCFAGVFMKDREPCRKSRNFVHIGQNIGGRNALLNVEGSIALITDWYNEIDNLEGDEEKKRDFVTVYPADHVRPMGQFTQMIWANEKYVGCARVWNPTNPNAYWRFALICNYGGSPNGANVPGDSVYEVGKKCSKCPEGTKCNSEAGGVYTALCGNIEPVPEALPIAIPKGTKPVEPDPTGPQPPQPTVTSIVPTNPPDSPSVAVFLYCEKKLISVFIWLLLLVIHV